MYYDYDYYYYIKILLFTSTFVHTYDIITTIKANNLNNQVSREKRNNS